MKRKHFCQLTAHTETQWKSPKALWLHQKNCDKKHNVFDLKSFVLSTLLFTSLSLSLSRALFQEQIYLDKHDLYLTKKGKYSKYFISALRADKKKRNEFYLALLLARLALTITHKFAIQSA